jgi:hypothetical protein
VNARLRDELLALVQKDQSFVDAPNDDHDSDEVQRWRLGVLDEVRQRFVRILDVHGWPGRSLVGEDGAEAAWMIALHTMPEPDVLRRCLTLMQEAAATGEADPSLVPFLVDRLSLIERNVQVYGTTICRRDDGSYGPPQLEDPEHVDERRRAVGLPRLEDDVRRIEAYHRAGR